MLMPPPNGIHEPKARKSSTDVEELISSTRGKDHTSEELHKIQVDRG